MTQTAEPASGRPRHWPVMTLRRRLVIAFGGLVTVAVILVGGITYSATVSTLNEEVDRSLVSAAITVAAGGTVATDGTGTTAKDRDGPGPGRDGDGDSAGATVSTVQTVAFGGATAHVSGTQVTLPVDDRGLQLASRGSAGQGQFSEATVDGVDYRIYTLALGEGRGAVQVGRDLGGTMRVLIRIALLTALIGLAVIALAVVAGWWIARQITKRLAVLSGVAETVARSGDLGVPIDIKGDDEVGRLGMSLQSMLAQLAESRDAQQRLVENAGHELRTPITSLRTNARVLRRVDDLPVDDRVRLLDDVDGELKELTTLVNELVELATDSRQNEVAANTDLGSLIEKVAGRVRRRTGRVINVDADDTVMDLRPQAIERAVTNLLENAAKFDPGDEPIDVLVRSGSIQVSDRGPGVATDQLEQIFERFHRTETARSLPGSGLGLAIVRDIADQHHGSVTATRRPEGGLTVTLDLRPDNAGS